ncbi:hypothetical protein LCAUW1_0760 [Lacticaseibacillus paracasei]|nr:hypothetical protein LCAUW1_0760 [Lacticaseibacillus paracasei]
MKRQVFGNFENLPLLLDLFSEIGEVNHAKLSGHVKLEKTISSRWGV